MLSISQTNLTSDLDRNMSALCVTASAMDEGQLQGALSHLNDDERKKILDVMRRAQVVEDQVVSRSR